MSGISANKLDFYIQDITSRISNSVENIKAGKNRSAFASSQDTAPAGKTAEPQKTGGVQFGISYLEPTLHYVIQRFVQENNGEDLRSRSNSGQHRQVEEEEGAVVENADGTADITSFEKELGAVMEEAGNNEYATAQNRPQNRLNAFSHLSSHLYEGIGSNYVSSVYDYVFNIDRRPEIKIEFMHKYNRNFDYTI